MKADTAKIELKDKITLTLAEASQLTGLSLSYLYKLSSQRKLPLTVVGNRKLIFRDDLEAWLRSKTRKTEA